MSQKRMADVVCLECGTRCGDNSGTDPYKHMLNCLNVESGSVSRIRDSALSQGNENGRRVAHLCDAILEVEAKETSSRLGNEGGN